MGGGAALTGGSFHVPSRRGLARRSGALLIYTCALFRLHPTEQAAALVSFVFFDGAS